MRDGTAGRHGTADPASPNDIQRQLELANSQMALYARDLKRMVDAERQKARALAEANARLEILDRLKIDFLAFIAHELRTPLSGMVVLDLLDPHDDPQTQAEMINILRHGYERLEGFIEKGLEYFRWLAADEEIDRTATTDLATTVHSVIYERLALTTLGEALQVSLPTTPCLIHGEEQHIAKVVQILLENALKFSEAHLAIAVVVQQTAEHTLLTISDQGQGFPPEMGQELLRPFTIGQVMHHSCGTALNLALANAIVTTYGGQLRAESAGVGKGATFTGEFATVTLL